MKQTNKLIITGGHLTPALATIQALSAYTTKILFLGRRTTGPSDLFSQEAPELKSLGIPFTPIDAPKLHRKPISKNFSELLKLYPCFNQIHHIIRHFSPDCLLSFGGYLALPVALTAIAHRIPIITHEQTLKLGLTNQLIAKFSHTVAVSWPQTLAHHPRFTLTGNPVRPEFLCHPTRPSWLPFNLNHPLLYITGGNQGARAINQFVFYHLPSWTKRYYLVHQTGQGPALHTQPSHASAISALTPTQLSQYHHQPWFSASDVAWLIRHADLVISRAGANTITELLVSNSRSILIPLPVSAANEQVANASLLVNHGLATLLPQSRLDKLPSLITSQLNSPPFKPSSPTQQLQTLHRQAAHQLARLVITCAAAH